MAQALKNIVNNPAIKTALQTYARTGNLLALKEAISSYLKAHNLPDVTNPIVLL